MKRLFLKFTFLGLLGYSAPHSYASSTASENVRSDSDKQNFDPSCRPENLQRCHDLARQSQATRDWKWATEYYQFACQQGLPKSCNNLGIMLRGLKLTEKALLSFKAACQLKHRTACKTGLSLAQKTQAKDLAWWRQAPHQSPISSNNSPPAATRQAHRFKTLNDLSNSQMVELCTNQTPSLCAAMAEDQENKGELDLAIELHSIICQKNKVYGCVKAAEIYRRLENLQGARLALQRACKHSEPEVCEQLRQNACKRGFGWQCSITPANAH
jgi:TPR repeat protein